MLHPSLLAAAGIFLASVVNAEPVQVKLGRTTIVGDYNATTGVDAFLGVRYATQKRFERAEQVRYWKREAINATVHAPSCVQINNITNPYGVTEDCLFLEIYRPHEGTYDETEFHQLPVMAFIHGGGGTSGTANEYLGYNFVKESTAMGMPVIVVTMNYRLAALGHLGGTVSVQNKAANLALYDQRTALNWIQDNIREFGGDKRKVTLWGQSYGSMAVHFHTIHEGRYEDLFRAAIMQSGNVRSVPALDPSHYDDIYKALVENTGCSASTDTLDCLKNVELSVLQNAVNKMGGNSVTYSTRPWSFNIDGEIIRTTPSKLLASGNFARKPFIHGDVLDEGTFFPNPTPMNTVEEMWAYFNREYLNKDASFLTNDETKAKILEAYPQDPALGSPYNTGNNTFGFGTQFKRAASFYGDIRYQAPRRHLLADALKYRVKSWSFQLTSRPPSPIPPVRGVYHSSDLAFVFLQIPQSEATHYELAKTMVGYWASFAHDMNPNHVGAEEWPGYGSKSNLMNFNINGNSIIPDIFRQDAMNYLNSIPEQFGNPE